METIDPTLAVVVAVVANFLYQGVIFFNNYSDTGQFPWSSRPKRIGINMFCLATIFKLLVAGCVVWGLTIEGQVNGVIGAAIIGMAGDEILINLAAAGRKVAKNAQA